MTMTGLRARLLAGVLGGLGLLTAQAAHAGYVETNLVGSNGVKAKTTDANLVNPWGLAASPTGAWWVANQNTGIATIYTATGAKIPKEVAIPPGKGAAHGPSGPTGMVFADGKFVVVNLDGSITTSTPGGVVAKPVGPTPGDLYTGLTTAKDAAGATVFFAANNAGEVEKLNAGLGEVETTGGFVDPNAKAGYTPFNVQTINGQVFVTYATPPGPGAGDQAAFGNGYVDVFDLDGNFQKRFADGGLLSSPWGLVQAPDDFGKFGGDILIGNFSHGTGPGANLGVINAFDPDTGAFKGTLQIGGKDLVIPSLWTLAFGKGNAASGPTDTLFFVAGGKNEGQGVFGSISAAPEPAAWALMIGGFGLAGAQLRRRGTAPA